MPDCRLPPWALIAPPHSLLSTALLIFFLPLCVCWKKRDKLGMSFMFLTHAAYIIFLVLCFSLLINLINPPCANFLMDREREESWTSTSLLHSGWWCCLFYFFGFSFLHLELMLIILFFYELLNITIIIIYYFIILVLNKIKGMLTWTYNWQHLYSSLCFFILFYYCLKLFSWNCYVPLLLVICLD